MGLKGVNAVTVSMRGAQGEGESDQKQLPASSTDPIKRKTIRESAMTNNNSSHFGKRPSLH